MRAILLVNSLFDLFLLFFTLIVSVAHNRCCLIIIFFSECPETAGIRNPGRRRVRRIQSTPTSCAKPGGSTPTTWAGDRQLCSGRSSGPTGMIVKLFYCWWILSTIFLFHNSQDVKLEGTKVLKGHFLRPMFFKTFVLQEVCPFRRFVGVPVFKLSAQIQFVPSFIKSCVIKVSQVPYCV